MKGLFFLLLLFSVAGIESSAQTPTGQRVAEPVALLDDYEVSTPGTLTVTGGIFYNRVKAGQDRSFPSLDLELGLTPWMDVSLSMSLSTSRFENFRTTATGDSYAAAKVRVLREGRRRPGVAFQPVLEVLGRPSLANNALAPGKVNAVFGAMVGKSFNSLRVYNHSGYFTRGVFFSSAALELDVSPYVVPTAYVTFGTLTGNRDAAASLQNNVSRPDLGGTLGFRLTKNWGGYVTTGRSFGRRDVNSSDYHVGAGLSYTWTLWGAR